MSRPNPDRLTDYLSQLSPEVAVFLVREIERQRADGKDDAVYDLVLGAAREVIRETGLKVSRRPDPLRLFCEPFEDLLFDDDRSLMQKGRVCRPSIRRVWSWLTSGEAVHDLTAVASDIEIAARRGNLGEVDALRGTLLDRGAEAIEHALEEAATSGKAQYRLEAHLGGRSVVFDAAEMAMAIRAAPAINRLRETLPSRIDEYTTGMIETLAGAVERCIDAVPQRPEFAFATLLARSSTPTQALRLAARRAGTNNAGRLAISSFGSVGDMLLHDLHIVARQVDELVRGGASAASVLFALNRYHRYAEGIERELDISVRSPWGERLASARGLASRALDTFIRGAPGLLSEMLAPRVGRHPGDAAPWPDPQSVQDVERAVTLLAGCRPFLDQLSLHEAVTVIDESLKGRLNLVADRILAELRHSAGVEKRAAQAWLDAVVSLTRILLSAADAELLERSGAVAAQATGTGSLAADG